MCWGSERQILLGWEGFGGAVCLLSAHLEGFGGSCLLTLGSFGGAESLFGACWGKCGSPGLGVLKPGGVWEV